MHLYQKTLTFILVTILWGLASVTEAYNHIDTPFYKVVLTSSYEDNLTGVHLKNKKQQDKAMKEFVAGRLAAGELGNGIELQNIKRKERKKKDDMFQAHGFDEYISELVSLNR